MNTKDMPPETKLPGHTYTLGEMRDVIAKMREINTQFYSLCFHGGMGSSCHAFVEFSGLQSKFIDMCEEALNAGIEFPFANQHVHAPWPIKAHHAHYLGEKFHCIWGFAIAPNPELREAFVSTGLAVEPHAVEPAR